MLVLFQNRDLLRQIDLSEKVRDLLAPFKEATVVISSEISSSVSLIRPLLHKLLNVCRPTPELEDSPLIHRAKAVLYHDLETR